MKRPLIYLFIFTVFFVISWFSLAYLTVPITESGHYNTVNISLFFILFFGSVIMATTLLVAAYKSVRPNRKLPSLLVKDSLIQGFIVGTWLTGLLMLQLLRATTVVNMLLWIIILIATEWTILATQKASAKSGQHERNNN